MIDAVYKDLISNILDRGYRYEDPNRKGVVRTEIPSYTLRHNFSDGFPAISLKKLAWKSVVTELIWFLKGDTNIKYLVDNGCNIWNKDAYNYYLKKNNTELEAMTREKFIETIKTSSYEELKNWFKDYTLGDLGKVYGYFWRNYDGFDQIQDIIDKMINTPMSSEIIVTSRNPNDKDSQALPCCHFNWNIVMRPLTLEERESLCSELGATWNLPFVEEIANKWNVPKYGFELHWKQRSVDAFLG